MNDHVARPRLLEHRGASGSGKDEGGGAEALRKRCLGQKPFTSGCQWVDQTVDAVVERGRPKSPPGATGSSADIPLRLLLELAAVDPLGPAGWKSVTLDPRRRAGMRERSRALEKKTRRERGPKRRRRRRLTGLKPLRPPRAGGEGSESHEDAGASRLASPDVRKNTGTCGPQSNRTEGAGERDEARQRISETGPGARGRKAQHSERHHRKRQGGRRGCEEAMDPGKAQTREAYHDESGKEVAPDRPGRFSCADPCAEVSTEFAARGVSRGSRIAPRRCPAPDRAEAESGPENAAAEGMRAG